MTEALRLKPADRVLEVGTGSGYAAAILGKIAREVYTIERHAELAETAARRLREQGFDNVTSCTATARWAGPSMRRTTRSSWPRAAQSSPRPLLAQLAIGGRLVIPVGEEKTLQSLFACDAHGADDYHREELVRRAVRAAGGSRWLGRERRKPSKLSLRRRLAQSAGAGAPSWCARRPSHFKRSRGRSRAAGGADRRQPAGSDWRGDARHVRVLSHAGRDHQAA